MTPAAPDPSADRSIDRRTLLGTGVLAGGVGLGLAGLASSPAYDSRLTPGAATLVGRLADCLLPRTDTASAGAPDNAAFILRGLEAGLFGASPASLNRVWRLLDKRQSVPFLDLDRSGQAAALAALDAEVFAPKGPAGTGWRQVKALILASYYTSEEGASRALRYDLVPGRYDPDVSVDATTRSFSSDWAGSFPVPVEGR